MGSLVSSFLVFTLGLLPIPQLKTLYFGKKQSSSSKSTCTDIKIKLSDKDRNYLNKYNIIQLFDELKHQLLNEKPIDPKKFLRDALIHKVIQERDLNRISSSTSPIHVRGSPANLPLKLSLNEDFALPKHDELEEINEMQNQLADYLKLNKNTKRRNKNRERSQSESDIIFDDECDKSDENEKCDNKNLISCVKLGPNPKVSRLTSHNDSKIINNNVTLSCLNLNKFNNNDHATFGFDIGGSLVKICYFERINNISTTAKIKNKFLKSNTTYGNTGTRDLRLSFPYKYNSIAGTFHFINFETHYINEAIKLFKDKKLLEKNELFYATGGGAFKFSELIKRELLVNLKKGDELECLLRGINFLLKFYPNELYYIEKPKNILNNNNNPIFKTYNINKDKSIYPYLLVNIGSGVSILRVDSPISYERVSGTCIGGGTYWGLCKLATQQSLTYNEAFNLALKGNSTKLNMTVGDIYGGDYKQFNLKKSTIASAFGKVISINDNELKERKDINDGDIARSLLDMIAMNVAQLAYLNAMRCQVSRILFVGNFLRQNTLSMKSIAFSIDYWSRTNMTAYFLKHEGYFGSIGVFLCDKIKD